MLARSVPGGMLGANLAIWLTALEHAAVGVATVCATLTPLGAMLIGSRVLGEHVR